MENSHQFLIRILATDRMKKYSQYFSDDNFIGTPTGWDDYEYQKYTDNAKNVDYLNMAIEFLQFRGIDTSNITDPIITANNIREIELLFDLQKRKKKYRDFVEFQADDTLSSCAVGCKGWDMVSKRCQCGNRRVGLVYDRVHFIDEDIDDRAVACLHWF